MSLFIGGEQRAAMRFCNVFTVKKSSGFTVKNVKYEGNKFHAKKHRMHCVKQALERKDISVEALLCQGLIADE